MTSSLKPLAAAALLTLAGGVASAATYDWSYTGIFWSFPNGVDYAGNVNGQLTGQFEGTADANGVTVTDMISLTFNDGTTNYDLSGVDIISSNPTYLFFNSMTGGDPYFSFAMSDSPGSEAVSIFSGFLLVLDTPSGSPFSPNWMGDGTGVWSLTEHVSAVPEPTTALLAMLGVPLVAWRARRRAQAEAA